MLYVILAWIGAALLGLVIIGFCAYELNWKLRRLRGETDKLQGTLGDLSTVQHELAEIQVRTAQLRAAPPSGPALTRD